MNRYFEIKDKVIIYSILDKAEYLSPSFYQGIISFSFLENR
jgi:hypothetical protein